MKFDPVLVGLRGFETHTLPEFRGGVPISAGLGGKCAPNLGWAFDRANHDLAHLVLYELDSSFSLTRADGDTGPRTRV